MTTRNVFPTAIVLLIVTLALFYSFTNTYTTTSELSDKVGRERADLYAMCDELAELSTPLGALAYRNLKQIQPKITTLEDCKTRLAARASMTDMADACDTLCETVSNLVGAINATTAVDSGEYVDLRAKLGDTLHQVSIARTAYIKAVEKYNAYLSQPVPSIWRNISGFKSAEPFVRPRKPVTTVFPAFPPEEPATVQPVKRGTGSQTNRPPAKITVKPATVQTNKTVVRSTATTAKPAAKLIGTSTNKVAGSDPLRPRS